MRIVHVKFYGILDGRYAFGPRHPGTFLFTIQLVIRCILSNYEMTVNFFTTLQKDMKDFRKKLLVILYESELNKLRGSPIYEQPGDIKKTSDSDIEELPGPNRSNSEDVANEKCTLPASMVSTNPHDLGDEIVRYIMSIDDVESLE